MGSAALALTACTVDLHPACNAQGEVDIDVEPPRSTAPVPERAPPASRRCPGPRHDGNTGCFPGRCTPGQYCDDPSSRCVPGCVSDANCGPRDTCVRPEGEPIGRCEACVEHEAHDPAEHCVEPSRLGTSDCFPGTCEPGQYCVNRGLNHCEPGCVSNDNCGPTERCERPDGAAVGTCASCYF